MGKYDKTYEGFKLPPRASNNKNIPSSNRSKYTGSPLPQRGAGNKSSLDEGMYYEIEYDSTPMPGVGKFVLKTQKIEAPEKDEIRELFDRMRDIARSNRSLVYGTSKFYHEKVRQENSKIFYKQGMFMKDFEDVYEETVPYKEYFPYYQIMGYKQLRTYFTWRTRVRKGQVENTSLSYAFLYLYELINNIGVTDPQDGLDKLLFFWKEFRVFEPDIDKYVLRWLKDYHIYYELPQTFPEFVAEKGLKAHYPELAGTEGRFDLFCSLSKYDIKKSVFYTGDRDKLIRDCFDFTVDRLNMNFSEHGFDLESVLFLPTKSRAVWKPFQDALFFPWLQQRDRSVVLSSKEVYVCNQDQWTYQTAVTAESGRQLATYILKRMESVLRQTVNYKYKISAGTGILHPMTVKKLEDAGISPEQSITDAVKEFYREATKTVVTVDRNTLARIRQEALLTQEKLLVPEEENLTVLKEAKLHATGEEKPAVPKEADFFASHDLHKTPTNVDSQQLALSSPQPESEKTDPWSEFKQMLTQTEWEALLLVLNGDADIKQFADAHDIMVEVLADGINEKAVDAVGDSLMDDGFMIYEDYLEQIREVFSEKRKR